jgi:tRNA(Ile)-lysidine synthase
MDLLGHIADILHEHLTPDPTPRILVAVSGGPDSVALLDLLARVRRRFPIELGVAHFNYRLRGEDSDEDALFVRDLADSYQLPLSVRSVSPVEADALRGSGLQERARNIRYRFFDDVCQRDGYSYVALGHHRDDQVETFFAHLLRGAGTDGLKGMRVLSARGHLRPLLGLAREDIQGYLARRALPSRIDVTNASPAYLRNRLRHDLIAALRRDHGGQALGAIAKTMDILAAESDLVEMMARSEVPGLISRPTETQRILNTDRFAALPLALRRRVARLVITETTGRTPPFTVVEQFLWLASGAMSGSTLDLGGQLAARRIYDRILLGPRPTRPPALPEVQILPGPTVDVPEFGIWIRAEEVPRAEIGHLRKDEYVADWDRVRFPLVLRHAKTGDRIAPLGLGGHHKTISRFFKDSKVPVDARTNALVLADQDRILWLVGHLVAEQSRLTAGTSRVLRVIFGKLPRL